MLCWAAPPLELWERWVPERTPCTFAALAGVCKVWRYRVIHHLLKERHLRRIWADQLHLNQTTLTCWAKENRLRPNAEELYRYLIRSVQQEMKALRDAVRQAYKKEHVTKKGGHKEEKCWCGCDENRWENIKDYLCTVAVNRDIAISSLKRMIL
jgi:hypothetical protein